MGKVAKPNRALIVGISKSYSTPFGILPGVAGDIAGIARILKSANGIFNQQTLATLTERKATRVSILSALKDVFEATADTVFVYLAGHGAFDKDQCYFVPFGVDINDLPNSAVPLSRMKEMFDASPADRVFLWLDFCHSGGILKRRGTKERPQDLIRRELKVVEGTGRIIMAACAEDQSAYEDPVVKHGLFTHALLEGLKGAAKGQNGEVNSHSLFDYINHRIGNDDQRPIFFGETRGTIALMHYPVRATTKASKHPAAFKAGSKSASRSWVSESGSWVLLADQFFDARRVLHAADGSIQVEIETSDAEQEEFLHKLKDGRRSTSREIAFAYRNDAFDVNVESVSAESTRGAYVWTVDLSPIEQSFRLAVTHSEGNRVYTPDDIAGYRARYILLNEKPPGMQTARSWSPSFGWQSEVTEKHDGIEVAGAIATVYASHRTKGNVWRHLAQLKALYLLKVTGTAEHVLELAIGAVKGGKVDVKFRGRCPRRASNVDAVAIEVSGACPL